MSVGEFVNNPDLISDVPGNGNNEEPTVDAVVRYPEEAHAVRVPAISQGDMAVAGLFARGGARYAAQRFLPDR